MKILMHLLPLKLTISFNLIVWCKHCSLWFFVDDDDIDTLLKMLMLKWWSLLNFIYTIPLQNLLLKPQYNQTRISYQSFFWLSFLFLILSSLLSSSNKFGSNIPWNSDFLWSVHLFEVAFLWSNELLISISFHYCKFLPLIFNQNNSFPSWWLWFIMIIMKK